MKSELSFLLELLLKHELQADTKDLISERIAQVEELLEQRFTRGTTPGPVHAPLAVVRENGPPIRPSAAPAPNMSTLTNEELAALAEQRNAAPVTPVPIGAVAQTPAAHQAMVERQQSIRAAASGKMIPIDGRSGPKKF